MWFLAFLVAATVISAQDMYPSLPVEIDPRCKKMDKEQWETFEKSESLRRLVFADLGLPSDYAYTEVLFGDGTPTGVDYSYFCAEGWNAVFEPATELQCSPTTIDVIDGSNNAPGTVGLNVQSGTLTSTTLTDTNAFTVAAGVSSKITGKIPLLGEADTTVSFTATYTRTWAKAVTFQTNTLAWVQRVINIGSGNSNCTATLATTTCQHVAQGKYPIVALGWIGWRLKDELAFKGAKARRWYVFIDSLPREERLGWAKLHAGIASQTYSTILSECDTPNSTTKRGQARRARSDRTLRDWRARMQTEIPDDPHQLRSIEGKLSRAKAAVPDHLKDKIMRVGNTLILPVGGDD